MATQVPALRAGRLPSRRASRAAAALSVTLLGGFSLHRGERVVPLPRGARRLAALVALHPTPLSRPQAAAMLWPALDEHRAAACLRSALSRLRSAVPDLLDADTTLVCLARAIRVDASEVGEWAMRLAEDDPQAMGAFDLAHVARLTTPLLPGWDDDWLVFERDRLSELGLDALERVAARSADEGRYARAVAVVYHVLRVDPLRESAACALIRMHLLRGNQAQAARVYLDFRTRLRADLGIEPSEAMHSLVSHLMPKPDRGR